MRKLAIGLSITVALLAGCIIGATASRIAVPPVRAGTHPTKWEHYCFFARNARDVTKYANKLGEKGFEMAAGAGGTGGVAGTFCFKRPVE